MYVWKRGKDERHGEGTKQTRGVSGGRLNPKRKEGRGTNFILLLKWQVSQAMDDAAEVGTGGERLGQRSGTPPCPILKWRIFAPASRRGELTLPASKACLHAYV